MKYPVVFGIILSALAMAGCGGKSDSDTTVAPPPAQNATQVGAQPAPSTSVAPPPTSTALGDTSAPVLAPPPGTETQSKDSVPGILAGVPKDAVPDLINLNNAFQAFRSIEMRSPKDLNELLSSGQIKSLPQPPSGMRYYIDERNLRITLVKE